MDSEGTSSVYSANSSARTARKNLLQYRDQIIRLLQEIPTLEFLLLLFNAQIITGNEFDEIRMWDQQVDKVSQLVHIITNKRDPDLMMFVDQLRTRSPTAYVMFREPDSALETAVSEARLEKDANKALRDDSGNTEHDTTVANEQQKSAREALRQKFLKAYHDLSQEKLDENLGQGQDMKQCIKTIVRDVEADARDFLYDTLGEQSIVLGTAMTDSCGAHSK